MHLIVMPKEAINIKCEKGINKVCLQHSTVQVPDLTDLTGSPETQTAEWVGGQNKTG